MPFNYPIINAPDAARDFQESFAGYNHNLRISDTEFYDMKNMTGDYYPVLSPRKKRRIVSELTNPQAIFCKDALFYIDNNHLYKNSSEILSFNSGHASKECEYKMIGMGAYLLVFEVTSQGLDNGWYVNTLDTTKDHGFIDWTNTITPSGFQPVSFSLCGKDGSAYENVTVSQTAPTSPQNGAKWLDTSGDTHYLKVYAATTSMWTTVLTTYVKLSCPGIGYGFKEGDAIDISGLAVSGSAKLQEQVNFLNANAIIQSIGENNSWIVITGIIDQVCEQTTGSVVLSRKAPYLDYICESNNRLWGCRYGLNRNNETVNEIYACKQGDFKNWFCYAGISTDSYAASVGTDGVWTGAVHFGSSVLFFKENCIHKLYGNMPADYQLIELKLRGVQNGSERSITNVNETLFYKTATEIVYYDGSLPVSVSYPLGETRYKNAVAGALGSKYYISMQDDSDLWHLFVYDAGKQMWHKEDNLHVRQFCKVGSQLFAIDGSNRLIEISADNHLEPDFEWYAETGYIGYSYSDNKYVGRIIVRLSKPLTSKIRLLISYDNDEGWETVSNLNGVGTRSCSIPVLPRRCDRFRVRIEGVGDCKIYSISKALEIGSDIN